jgi:hypothetical protein
MRKARWLAEWRKAAGKPVLYHVHSRVVDRRFVLGTEEKEKFRTLMRMQENFTGCRAISYCLMDYDRGTGLLSEIFLAALLRP